MPGTADPEKFYDNTIVKELETSGFIASLFGKKQTFSPLR